jgi:hypothetical protein
VAGLLHGEDAALHADLAATTADVAGFHLAVFRAAAITVTALDQGRDLDAALHAGHRFLQVQLHHVADVGTATRLARATAATEDVAEDVPEDVVHVRAAGTAATAHAVLERGVAVGVVHAPLVAVGQHFVGFLALLEGGLGRRVTGVAVRVELHRAATVGLLQFLVAGVAGHAQYFVVIALAHALLSLPLRGGQGGGSSTRQGSGAACANPDPGPGPSHAGKGQWYIRTSCRP